MEFAHQGFTGQTLNAIITQNNTSHTINGPNNFITHSLTHISIQHDSHCHPTTLARLSFYTLFLYRIDLIPLEKCLSGCQQLLVHTVQTWSSSQKSNNIPHAKPVKSLMTYFLTILIMFSSLCCILDGSLGFQLKLWIPTACHQPSYTVKGRNCYMCNVTSFFSKAVYQHYEHF
jgi:hypothetical protein